MRSKIKILNFLILLFFLHWELEQKLKEKQNLLNKCIINSQISYRIKIIE